MLSLMQQMFFHIVCHPEADVWSHWQSKSKLNKRCLPNNFLQLICIQDGYLSLLTESGEVREDLKVPEGELGKEIEGKYNAGEDFQVRT